MGVVGSWIGFVINWIAMAATFYVAIAPLDVMNFFQSYIAAPITIAFWLGWKIYSGKWRLLVPISEMDVHTGMKEGTLEGRYHDPAEANRPAWRKALSTFI